MTELRIIARCALILAGTLASVGAGAQTPASAAPSANSASAADRAQKETDRTLYWIRVLAEKPAPKAAAPKAVAVAPQVAKPAAVAADSRPAERVKVASSGATSGAETPPANSSNGSVVAAAPAATAPSVALPTGAAGNPATMASSGGLDAGVAGPAVAGGIAAPTLTPPSTVDVPSATPEVEEPDPGLIMTKSADPQFPMATMKRLRKGEVEVRFEVGADGQVDVVSVVKSTNSSLNDAALNAVRQWQFKPTPHGHTAVVDLAFNLDA